MAAHTAASVRTTKAAVPVSVPDLTHADKYSGRARLAFLAAAIVLPWAALLLAGYALSQLF